MNLSTGQEIDFSAVENRLDISLPMKLKRIYLAIQNQEEYFTSTEHFLPLDEIYMNGFYADIHAGADDKAQLEALAEHLGAMEWK